jgi:hypothetical protein
MSRQASVLSFEALEELDHALARFSGNAMEALQRARSEIDRGFNLLDERLDHWRERVSYWQEEYGRADPEEDDIAYISNKLEEAENELANIERWQSRLEECYASYSRQARRLDEVASERIEEARTFLREKIEQLRGYGIRRINRDSIAQNPASLVEVNDPISSAIVGTAAPTLVSGRLGDETLTAFPLPKGFVWIPLSEIDPAELGELPSESEFKKISYGEVKRGLGILETKVLPAIKENPNGANSEYFENMDRKEGYNESNGAAKVFSAFFGQVSKEYIRLEKKAGTRFFSITNGRHRIKAAMDLGWTAVPAEAIEVK